MGRMKDSTQNGKNDVTCNAKKDDACNHAKDDMLSRGKKAGNRVKKSTLSRFFMRYVLLMLTALSAWIVVVYVVFNICINMGFIYPANDTEQKIEDAYETLQSTEEITKEMIPASCGYAVFSTDGELISGNLSENYVKEASDAVGFEDNVQEAQTAVDDEAATQGIQNEENNIGTSGSKYYTIIPRDGEYLVLQYDLTPHYRSSFLNDYFIDPQSMMLAVSILGMIAIMLTSSVRFGKKIKAKMNPLLDSIEKIKNKELEYETSYSGIEEIDDCIASMDDMRTALKTSLEMQWKMEQDKNKQMSALAHDIKTPLTVVRGNAELLAEMNSSKEQRKNIDYILNSAMQMQDYVQKLIEVTKSAEGIMEQFKETDTKKMLSDIRQRAEGLAEANHVEINWNETYQSEKLTVLYEQVIRAMMNIVQNAMEHTNGKEINITIQEKNRCLKICVEDYGTGFSENALKHGTEQFFMDDESRGDESHYGIGLFFADAVAKKHHGEVTLSNSQKTGGAKVELSLMG